MVYLFYFVGGVLFYSLISPLIETLIEIVVAKKEVYVSKCNTYINRNNVQMTKDRAEVEPSSVSAIGFDYSAPEEEWYDDDDDDDEDCGRRIGF